MPSTFKVSKHKKYRKKFAKKMFKKQYKNTLFCKLPGGFENRALVHFKFARSNVLLGSGTLVGDTETWMFNDPTNGNTNIPLGWVQYRQVYNTYLVRASRMKATFLNLSSTIPARISVLPINEATLTTLPMSVTDAVSQQALSKTKYLSIAGGGKDTVTITNFQKLKKIAGVPKLDTSYETYLGFTGSTVSQDGFTQPAQKWFWLIAAQSSQGSNLAANSIAVDYEIDYYVEFHEKLPFY